MTRPWPVCVVSLLVVVLVGGLAACSDRRRSDSSPQPANDGARDAFAERWKLEIEPYFGDASWEESVVEGDRFLLHTRDGILGIDSVHGQVAWEGQGTFGHPRDRIRPLFRLPDLTSYAELSALVEVDPADGRELRTLTLEQPLRSINMRIAVTNQLVVVRVHGDEREEFVAVDAATGKTRWRVPAAGTDHSAPVFTRDRFIVRAPYQAYRLDDGSVAWTKTGGYDVAAAPDGSHVYVRTNDEPSRFAELDSAGTEVRTFDGRLLAVTDTHLAFDTGTSLRVISHEVEKPVLDVPYKTELPHVAVTLSPSAIYYFDQDADAVFHHGLDNGERTEIVKLAKRAVFSTERSDVLEPFLSFAPKVDGTAVFLSEASHLRRFDLVPARN